MNNQTQKVQVSYNRLGTSVVDTLYIGNGQELVKDFYPPGYLRNITNLKLNYTVDPNCNNCYHLYPKEAEQTKKNEPHRCWKYKIIIKHAGYHPDLPKPKECTSFIES